MDEGKLDFFPTGRSLDVELAEPPEEEVEDPLHVRMSAIETLLSEQSKVLQLLVADMKIMKDAAMTNGVDDGMSSLARSRSASPSVGRRSP